jgi:hypothetical protein
MDNIDTGIVEYDSLATYTSEPYAYRSERLYGKDLRLMMGVGSGALVQVIRNHGDEMWTEARLITSEEVGDYGMVRFIVRLADGSDHMVSQDRIRLAR